MDGLFDYPRIFDDDKSNLLHWELNDFVYLRKEDAVKEGVEHNEYIQRQSELAIDEIKRTWGEESDDK